MFLIYSLEPETLDLTPYEIKRHRKDAIEVLTTLATQFIRTEHGDKRAESPFKDTLKDSEIIEDGYFLRRESEFKINVFKRITTISKGYLLTGVYTDVKLVKFYAIKQADINIETSSEEVVMITKPHQLSEKQNTVFSDMLVQLKEKLQEREEKRKQETNTYSLLPISAPPTPPPLPIFNMATLTYENPLYLSPEERLRHLIKRIRMEHDIDSTDDDASYEGETSSTDSDSESDSISYSLSESSSSSSEEESESYEYGRLPEYSSDETSEESDASYETLEINYDTMQEDFHVV